MQKIVKIKMHYILLISIQTNFLRNFNHLSRWSYSGEEMPTREVIESLQLYLNLAVTGELNAATCTYMENRFDRKIITWQ